MQKNGVSEGIGSDKISKVPPPDFTPTYFWHSRLADYVGNWWFSQKLSEIVGNCQEIVGNCRKLSENVGKCRKLSEIVGKCRKMSEIVGKCRKMSEKMSENVSVKSGGDLLYFHERVNSQCFKNLLTAQFNSLLTIIKFKMKLNAGQ